MKTYSPQLSIMVVMKISHLFLPGLGSHTLKIAAAVSARALTRKSQWNREENTAHSSSDEVAWWDMMKQTYSKVIEKETLSREIPVVEERRELWRESKNYMEYEPHGPAETW